MYFQLRFCTCRKGQVQLFYMLKLKCKRFVLRREKLKNFIIEWNKLKGPYVHQNHLNFVATVDSGFNNCDGPYVVWVTFDSTQMAWPRLFYIQHVFQVRIRHSCLRYCQNTAARPAGNMHFLVYIWCRRQHCTGTCQGIVHQLIYHLDFPHGMSYQSYPVLPSRQHFGIVTIIRPLAVSHTIYDTEKDTNNQTYNMDRTPLFWVARWISISTSVKAFALVMTTSSWTHAMVLPLNSIRNKIVLSGQWILNPLSQERIPIQDVNLARTRQQFINEWYWESTTTYRIFSFIWTKMQSFPEWWTRKLICPLHTQ